MPFAEVPTPFRNIPIAPSGGVSFGDLAIRFIIDEDMENYLSIHDWIREYGLSDERASSKDDYSYAILQILTSHNNVNHQVEFTNIFPVSLSGVPFDATVGDIEYLMADAVFKYEKYDIRTSSFAQRT